jgi:hypothetical protein
MAYPKVGPINMIKVDLPDGYYWVWVKIKNLLQLSAIFHSLDGENFP